MKSAVALFLLLFLGIFVGFGTGKLMHRKSPQKNGEDASLRSKDDSPYHNGGKESISGVSETTHFGHLSSAKQKEVVTRLAERIERFHSQSDLLLLAKVVRDLNFEQAAELLSCLQVPDWGERERDMDAFTIICERLAAIDSEKALRLGVDTKNGALISATLNSLSHQSPVLALGALAGLPAEIRENFDFDYNPGQFASRRDGDLSDFATIASVIKKHPEAVFESSPENIYYKGFANQLVRCILDSTDRIGGTDKIKFNPTEAIASLREISESLRQYARNAPGKEAAEGADRIFYAAAGHFIRSYPGIYDSLQGRERENPFIVYNEAWRLREESLEKAMKFAESQKDAALAQEAIKGVASGLDEETLMQWADSLTDGPAKQGAMWSVALQHAFSLLGSQKEDGEVCQLLANQFESDESKIAFLTPVFGDSLIPRVLGLSDRQSTFTKIEKLAVSNAVKAELWRRTAAIPLE